MADDLTVPGTLDTWLAPAIGALVEKLYDPDKLQRVQRVVENGIAKGQTIANGAQVAAGPDTLGTIEKIGRETLDVVERVLGVFLGEIVALTLGVDIPVRELFNPSGHPEDSPFGRAIATVGLKAMTGTDGELNPTDAGAIHLLSTIAHIVAHSWAVGIAVEKAEKTLSTSGQIESFEKLGKELVDGLGLNRLARVALRPLVQATIATPLQWKVNKQYKPTLLSPASVIRQFLRGKWAWEDAHEELARQGYSEARIDALLNEQQRFLSVADVRQLLSRTEWTQDQALQHLRDQGYDEDAAQLALRVEGSKRFEQLENAEVSALTAAYVNRDIDDAEFQGQLSVAVRAPTERALATELAQLRRALNVKRLSAVQAAACVKAGVLAVPDYRAALRLEGYAEGAVLALELLLRHELDEKRSIDEHRKAADADRVAEKAARDKAAAEKRAELDAARALKRRGNAGDLERAVVRGLVPISRYRDVIAADFDADTVDVLVALVESERTDFVDREQLAAAARQRAARKAINVGELEAAVLSDVLSVAEFRARLASLGFDDTDANVLTATIKARKADQVDARAKHAQAELDAKIRRVNLPVFEQLVRRGIRTLADYDALLASLGYDDADRASLRVLLQDRIDDDRAAAAARAAADAAKAPGELTIAEFRRAVLLGVKTPADFESFLVTQGLSADEHALIMAELVDDLAQADAARQRRQQVTAPPGSPALSLDTVRQAARLGIVSVQAYQNRLARDGYSVDDIAIDTDLLLLEIADVQAARQQRDAVAADLSGKGLTLAQLEKAVKAGLAPLDSYRARAFELGLTAAAVDTLTRVLGDELRETQAAQVRRTQLESDLKAKDVTLALLEQRVRDGAATLDEFYASLVRLGIAPEDADVLWTLLADALTSGAAAG